MLPELARHAEKLYYFYEISHHGSLQSCARSIGVSAPTLSYNVKTLEEIVGSDLFTRSKGGVTLTPQGELLVEFCRRYFKELEIVQSNMNSPHTQQTHLRLGTFQSIAIYYLPILLRELKKTPDISVSMMTGRSNEIQEALIQRHIELALTVETFRQTGIVRHELYRDKYCFYMHGQFPKSTLDERAIEEQSLFYIPDAADRNKVTLRQNLQRWGLSFREEFEFDSFEVVAEFVIKKFGIGILPTRVAKRFGSQLKPVRVKPVPERRFGEHRFFLSYREDLDLPQQLMDLFLNSALKAAKTS